VLITETPAIILAGGRGTRLQSVVSDRPKVLADVAGRPYLALVLDRLQRLGVPQAVLSTGYMAGAVEAAIGSSHGGMPVRYAREESPLGTGGGAALAASLVSAPWYLILNGDSWCETDLARFVAAVPRDCDAGMLLTRVSDVSRYGAVHVGPDSRVESFREKETGPGDNAGPDNAGSDRAGLINAGGYLLSRRCLDTMSGAAPLSLERDVFPVLAAQGRIYGYMVEAPFIDIGTPESYARVLPFFKEAQNR
jgi:NDP-sugar pyrophosphorylase family protein